MRSATNTTTTSSVGFFCLPVDVARAASTYAVNVNLTYTWACNNLTSAPAMSPDCTSCTATGSCCSTRAVQIGTGSAVALPNICVSNTSSNAYQILLSSAAGNLTNVRACLPAGDNGMGSNNTNSTSNAMIVKYSMALLSAVFALAFF